MFWFWVGLVLVVMFAASWIKNAVEDADGIEKPEEEHKSSLDSPVLNDNYPLPWTLPSDED